MTVGTDKLTNRLGTGSPDFPEGMPTVGGDPIVESGSNSDGEWTRWADGTQIVRKSILTDPGGFTTVNLASGFIDTEYRVGGCVANSNTSTLASPKIVNKTTNTLDASSVSSSDSFSGFVIDLVIAGDWK